MPRHALSRRDALDALPSTLLEPASPPSTAAAATTAADEARDALLASMTEFGQVIEQQQQHEPPSDQGAEAPTAAATTHNDELANGAAALLERIEEARGVVLRELAQLNDTQQQRELQLAHAACAGVTRISGDCDDDAVLGAMQGEGARLHQYLDTLLDERKQVLRHLAQGQLYTLRSELYRRAPELRALRDAEQRAADDCAQLQLAMLRLGLAETEQRESVQHELQQAQQAQQSAQRQIDAALVPTLPRY